MTIRDFLAGYDKLPHKSKTGETIREAMERTTHVWDNEACRGYCYAAMKAAGLDNGTIRSAMRQLRFKFDEMTIEDAEQAAIEYFNLPEE